MIGNRDFLPGVQKSLFHRWYGKSIRVAGDLLAYLLFYSIDQSGIDHIWHTWEKEFCTEHIDDAWVDLVKSIRSIFMCNRLVIITPQILNKINSNHFPLCNKLQSENGTFMHCFWHCPVITKFWEGVTWKREYFSNQLDQGPWIFYLFILLCLPITFPLVWSDLQNIALQWLGETRPCLKRCGACYETSSNEFTRDDI